MTGGQTAPAVTDSGYDSGGESSGGAGGPGEPHHHASLFGRDGRLALPQSLHR